MDLIQGVLYQFSRDVRPANHLSETVEQLRCMPAAQHFTACPWLALNISHNPSATHARRGGEHTEGARSPEVSARLEVTGSTIDIIQLGGANKTAG